jgi:hypothetical protein
MDKLLTEVGEIPGKYSYSIIDFLLNLKPIQAGPVQQNTTQPNKETQNGEEF